MVVGCWGPRQQGHTSSSDYVTPVTAVPVRGCTPDCLRKPVTGRHPSCGRGFQSLFPFLRRARTQEGCKVTSEPSTPLPSVAASPRLLALTPCACSLARSLSVFLPFLRSRPPSRPNQPLRQTPPRAPPPPPRTSYAATAITFAGKSSGAVREPGLTLQGAGCAALR